MRKQKIALWYISFGMSVFRQVMSLLMKSSLYINKKLKNKINVGYSLYQDIKVREMLNI